jgi:hypothetical protein
MLGQDNALLRAMANAKAMQGQTVDEQIAQAIAWLESKWTKDEGKSATSCPYCGHNSWSVGPPLELATQRSAMAPMFPVVCDTCGHTTFVSAIVSGLVQKPADEL